MAVEKRSLKRNIYKIDDVFLIISWILLVVLVIRILGYIPYMLPGAAVGKPPLPVKLRQNMLFFILVGGSFIFLQAVGRSVHRKERRLQRIIDVILDAKSITLTNLSREAGVPLGDLRKDVAEIERHNRAFIRLTTDSVSVEIGESISVTATCDSCGASARYDISVDTRDFACSYCGAPIEVERMNKAKEEVLRKAQARADSLQETKKLNVGLLVILFVIFWPGAIIYLAIHFMNKNKDGMLFQEIQTHFPQEPTQKL